MRKKHNRESGLTLIEVMVATGIFGVVITMAIGIFVIALVSQRRIIALRNVEDNARFALESMSREIRTGKDFGGGGTYLTFTNAKGESVAYRINNKTIEKSSNNGVDYFSVTGPEATIDYLNFSLLGQAAGDGLQPRVSINFGITSKIGNQSVSSKVQTTISERFLQL